MHQLIIQEIPVKVKVKIKVVVKVRGSLTISEMFGLGDWMVFAKDFALILTRLLVASHPIFNLPARLTGLPLPSPLLHPQHRMSPVPGQSRYQHSTLYSTQRTCAEF